MIKFVLLSQLNKLFTENPLLIVYGGNAGAEIEVVNVGSPSGSCTYYNDNYQSFGMVGFLDYTTFIVCGPNSNGTHCKNSELPLSSSNWNWNIADFRMLEDRSYATILELGKSHYWITGGEILNGPNMETNVLKTTEIFQNSNFIFGPDMLQPTFSHCMAKINLTHIVTTGGKSSVFKVLNEIHTINMNFRTNWTKLPSMYSKRFGHSCGVTKDQLIVTGGLNMDTTETFSFERLEW